MKRRRNAFTLVELLVVIGILSVLISILLPSLNKARRAANSLQCQSNLRTIAQAMLLYVQQSKGYIPGSPNTTGIFPPGPNQFNVPNVNQIWDWETPLLNVMGVPIPYSPTANATRSNGQACWDRV